MASLPASFTGCVKAGMTALVPTRTRLVRAATAARKVTGSGLYPPYVKK